MSVFNFKFYRRAFVFLHDIFMTFACLFLVYFILDAGGDFTGLTETKIEYFLLFILLASVFIYLKSGIYKGIWRFASIGDLRLVGLSVFFVALVSLSVLTFVVPFKQALLFSFLLVLLLPTALAFGRLVYRIWVDFSIIAKRPKMISALPTLIVGMDDDVDVFLHKIERSFNDLFLPLGIVTLQPQYNGRTVRGIPILGDFSELESLIKTLKNQANGLRKLVVSKEILSKTGAQEFLQTMARDYDLSWSMVSDFSASKMTDQGSAARDMRAEDLLQRQPRHFYTAKINKMVFGKVCFVSGAGGSIGVELCLQLLESGARQVIAFDMSEFSLFTLEETLVMRDLNNKSLVKVVGNVRDSRRLQYVFEQYRPDLVFHAAAMKHIPFCEANWREAALTNTLGTKRLADVALQYNVEGMVLISTDKAVKPVSILGATKRLAEVYMEAIDQSLREGGKQQNAKLSSSRARFLSVRFGNVLGSSGSVLQRFRSQIANRQPITVTHPDMVRYFMTVREAVNLVLQASSNALEQNASEGSVFVLDMGEPIRIADMAERLIRLYGLEPGVDVPIIFTGMREGERLYEEIFDSNEPVHETDVEGVFAAEPHARPMDVVEAEMLRLLELIEKDNKAEAVAYLQEIVPGYVPK